MLLGSVVTLEKAAVETKLEEETVYEMGCEDQQGKKEAGGAIYSS